MIGLALLGASHGTAAAAPNLRVQVSQRGDFVLIGNTLAHECAAGTPAPVVGTVPPAAMCGTNTADTAPDIFWRADSPMAGQAEASTSVTPAQARSTAVLSLPPTAEVTHAYLYWAGTRAAPDLNVTLERGPFNVALSGTLAAQTTTGTTTHYQAYADVTSIVQTLGPGAFRVSGVDAIPLANVNESFAFAGWWMVVLYKLNSDPARNLALFDSLDFVFDGAPQDSTITGFVVPNANFSAKLGVVAYDGDNTSTGDGLQWNMTSLSDALNPADNFFNSTRSTLGAGASVAGDLPQLTGGPQSMGGMDLDVVQIPTNLLAAGQTSALVTALSSADSYLLGGLVTSITTLLPDLSTSSKMVTDLNGGGVAPGDELEYAVTVTNTGTDAAANVVLNDPLPADVSFVAGSLEVVNGPNMGAKTDMDLDDQAEYTAGNHTVTFRLGTGADGGQGGTLAINQSTTVRFRVTVDAGADGLISNQAIATAQSPAGGPQQDYPTDGNGNMPGSPPTDVVVDSDNDGLSDGDEDLIGTDPNDADSDDDGVGDGQEPGLDEDSDNDGLIGGLDVDSDNDGLYDGTELGLGCNGPGTDAGAGHCIPDGDAGATQTDPLDADTDNGGVPDGSEDFDRDGVVDGGETDPTAGNGADDALAADSDGDGLSDGLEDAIGTDPDDADSDDDGALDGDEPNPADDGDGDGVANAADPDSDNDALFDGTELGEDCNHPATDPAAGNCRADADGGATTTSPIDPDSDDGGASDGSEDWNLNGRVDAGETDPTPGQGGDDPLSTDADGDGLSDDLEAALGTDPSDADSDDDGAIDGQEANPSDDTDGDGVLNALDADSDNDGLYDGTELGFDCNAPGTDPDDHCVADGDGGATTTSPINADTDGGGASDGSEDWNLNGVVDANETDPGLGSGGDDGQVTDTDGDGLGDLVEGTLGSAPDDGDTDDDGVPDGGEANPADDHDHDGLIDVLDVDSDNDGLYDGTELGLDCSGPGTDVGANHCTADGDGGATTTSPIDRDTDGGGASDGSEDADLNGVVDAGETDPTTGNGGDDGQVLDTDGDGLGDLLEGTLMSDPGDADSDDDGLLDGQEPNPADDHDGDGAGNVLDEDSDGDGLFDGTEAGQDCSNPATDAGAGQCAADADGGVTTTGVLDADSDDGGVPDGQEDANHNGTVDAGETDPNDPTDDLPAQCQTDADCGEPDSGMVCNEMSQCQDGCRGTDGNGCPAGLVCTSMDDTIGECVVPGTGGAGGTTTGAGGEEPESPTLVQGGGCTCGVPAGSDEGATPWALLAAGVAAAMARRRRRRG